MMTISIIKAELLLLSQNVKKDQYIKCLLNELNVSTDDQQIQIHCDNCQIIRLVTEKIACLQTKLQHINIHNHWLRQEVRDEQITVKYIPTKKRLQTG